MGAPQRDAPGAAIEVRLAEHGGLRIGHGRLVAENAQMDGPVLVEVDVTADGGIPDVARLVAHVPERLLALRWRTASIHLHHLRYHGAGEERVVVRALVVAQVGLDRPALKAARHAEADRHR